MIVVGDYLYSSCRGADYGRVLSVTLTKTSPRTNGLPHGRIRRGPVAREDPPRRALQGRRGLDRVRDA